MLRFLPAHFHDRVEERALRVVLPFQQVPGLARPVPIEEVGALVLPYPNEVGPQVEGVDVAGAAVEADEMPGPERIAHVNTDDLGTRPGRRQARCHVCLRRSVPAERQRRLASASCGLGDAAYRQYNHPARNCGLRGTTTAEVLCFGKDTELET